jgi:hypothetical protein
MNETGEPRRLGRSALALLAGFFLVVLFSLVTDLLMQALGFLPRLGEPVTTPPLLLATVYRTIYSIAGSYLTAKLAPYHPMAHALTGGAIGTVIGLVGAVTTWNKTALGPHWYPVTLVVLAVPSAWLGGWLYLRQTNKART